MAELFKVDPYVAKVTPITEKRRAAIEHEERNWPHNKTVFVDDLEAGWRTIEARLVNKLEANKQEVTRSENRLKAFRRKHGLK